MFGFFGTILLQLEFAQCKQRETIARIEFKTGFQNLGGILEAVAKQVRLCQLMTSEGEGMITGITRFGHSLLEELEASRGASSPSYGAGMLRLTIPPESRSPIRRPAYFSG